MLNNINRYYLILCLSFISIFTERINAEEIPVGNKKDSFIQFEVKDVFLANDTLRAHFEIDLCRVNMQRNHEAVITPILANDNDTICFITFRVAGHNRYYYHQRFDESIPMIYKGWGKAKNISFDYSVATEFIDWMANASFSLKVEEIGCSDCYQEEKIYALTNLNLFPQDIEIIAPEDKIIQRKGIIRELSTRAYIDFPVNKTEIYPDYRNNPIEIAKILAVIDSIKADKDINIKSIHITGTASPEGPYDNNIRLAEGRTAALKDYICSVYNFPAAKITTSYQPVDWNGLKEWLENNDIKKGEEILAIVNSDLESYTRNQKIKKLFPLQYKWLLNNVYPSLRHSDFDIVLEIKTISDEE